jgi:signal transduction histidine kinase
VGGEGEEAFLAVENEGPPIPPELMAVIFEPFCRGSTLRGTSRVRGLGLGLFIARQIVGAHGGDIGVTSSAERGTRFTVRLPRRARGSRPSQTWAADAPGAAAQA